MQSGIFLLRYRTEMTDDGKPMPALVLRMPIPTYGYVQRNAMDNQRVMQSTPAIFPLSPEQGCWDYRRTPTGRRQLILAVIKGVDWNGCCIYAALSIHGIDCSVPSRSMFFFILTAAYSC
jgi:hypothetical protein